MKGDVNAGILQTLTIKMQRAATQYLLQYKYCVCALYMVRINQAFTECIINLFYRLKFHWFLKNGSYLSRGQPQKKLITIEIMSSFTNAIEASEF